MYIFLNIEPPPADFTGYLLWSIGILGSVVAALFTILKANFEARLKEKDEEIKRQAADMDQLSIRYNELVNEMMPKMVQTNHLAQAVIKLLNDERKQ